MELPSPETPSIWSHISLLASKAGTYISTSFYQPFYNLYRNGPRLFGFWQGASNAQICAYDTNMEPSFWMSENNAVMCATIVETRFRSYVALVQACVFGFAIYEGIRMVVFRLCVWRCIMRDVNKTVKMFKNRNLVYDKHVSDN